MSDRVAIASLDARGLADLSQELGQPAYRGKQLVAWLYKRLAPDFSAMTDLSGAFRAELAERTHYALPVLADVQRSADGTRKYLWTLEDGARVESVGIPAGDRLTVCFSTQAGCAMGCTFCATGRGGFARNLGAGEMVWQVALVARDFGTRASNAVAMGQGEPFMNYDATIGALRLMNAKDGLGVGARHLTISTCGVLPGIKQLAMEPEQFTLAVSLHSAVQATRDAIMPGVKRWPLDHLRRALIKYVEDTGRRPTLEYALIAGVNDTPAEVAALVAFARGWMCHVNVIPINPVKGTGAGRPIATRVNDVVATLTSAGIEASIRAERGTDIDAACGQLTQRHRAPGE